MPDLEKHLDEFKAIDTQVLGISIDSKYSNDNWASLALGGISFPLLSDFHPKGAMAQSYGLYLDEKGITDRATVIIDKSGTVQYVKSVGPPGLRSATDLLAECQKVNAG